MQLYSDKCIPYGERIKCVAVFPINHQMGGRKPSSEALYLFLEQGWMPLYKKFIAAEDSRRTTMQCVITYSFSRSMSLLTRIK